MYVQRAVRCESQIGGQDVWLQQGYTGDHNRDHDQNYQDHDEDDYNIIWGESSSYLFCWLNIRNPNDPKHVPSKSCLDVSGSEGVHLLNLTSRRDMCGFGKIGELPASIKNCLVSCLHVPAFDRELANLVQASDTTFRPPFLFCIFYSNPMLTIQINPLLLINRVLN